MWKQRLELFRGVVPEETLREGVQAHKDHRVKCVALCKDDLVGFVELDTAWNVAKTQVAIYPGGRIAGTCTCGSPEKICPHMIATVLGTSKLSPPNHPRRNALVAVRRAGKREVVVSAIAVDEHGHGTWSAQTMGRHRPGTSIHLVEIYSLSEPANECSCSEYQFDQLGTCRHVEGVLYRLDSKALPARSVVYVDWAGGEPILRISWSASHAGAPPAAIAGLFDDERYAVAAPQDVVEAVEASGDVAIGLAVRQLLDREIALHARARRGNRVVREMRGLRTTPTFHGSLRPFQEEGVEFLVRHGSAVLADEMGLGKTVQAIAAADWMMTLGEVSRVLVICPASIKVPASSRWCSAS